MAWFRDFDVVGAFSQWRVRKNALKVWENGCVWNLVELGETGLPWVAAGGLSASGLSSLRHLSAYQAMERCAYVDHWVPRVAAEAVDMLDRKSVV